MARIRSVKPEYWTDPDVVDLPMAARLFFIGTWNHADDYGVLKDEPARLKMQILPADDVDPWELVEELVQSNLLLRKIAPDGTKVLVIRTFTLHQKIDRRSEGRWGNPEDFTDPPPIPTTPAESPRVPTTPAPGRELVLEGTGQEGKGSPSSSSASETNLALVPSAPPTRCLGFAEWWDLYPRKVGKQAARKKYEAALRRAAPEALIGALVDHRRAWQQHGYELQFIPHPATWLEQGRWEDDPPGPRANGRPSRADDNRAKIEASLARMEGRA